MRIINGKMIVFFIGYLKTYYGKSMIRLPDLPVVIN
jgi:hypothetical protein